MKLHLGCWHRYIPGFIHVDLSEHKHIDYVSDIGNLSFIDNETVDYIYCSHALEYKDFEQAINVFNEWNRVLKKKGKLMISVPHEDLSYAYVKGDINQHLYTWSPMSIGNLIQNAGFEIEEVRTIKMIQPPFASLIFKIFGIIGYKISGKFYRMIRKALTPFKRIGVSADIIVYATKS